MSKPTPRPEVKKLREIKTGKLATIARVDAANGMMSIRFDSGELRSYTLIQVKNRFEAAQ